MIKKILPVLKFSSYLLWVPFILTVSFEIITFSDWIYEFNWEKNNISYKTNLSKTDLNEASDQIKDYFKNDQEKINIVINRDKSFKLFNQREIDHMVDVKNLIKSTLLFEKISLFIIFFYLVLFSYKKRIKRLSSIIIRIIHRSLLIWSGIMLIIIFGMIINFNASFVLFHRIFFRNDLWILDPRNDYLLIMFPESFFLEISITIIGLFAIINFLFYIIAWIFNKKLNPR